MSIFFLITGKSNYHCPCVYGCAATHWRSMGILPVATSSRKRDFPSPVSSPLPIAPQ